MRLERWRSRVGRAVLIMMTSLIAGGSVAAAAPPSPSPPPPRVSSSHVLSPHARDVSDAAVKRRQATHQEYSDQASSAAISTITERLPDLVDVSPWQPLALPTGFSITAFADNDHTAAVRSPDGKSLALSSTAPLRAADPDTGILGPVDLQLVPRGDGFGPANGLAPVELPSDISAGLGVGRFTLGVVGAASASAQRVDDTVVWPNSLRDTDVVAHPTVSGLELSLALRSVDSPQDFPLTLGLPAGATVRAAGGGALEMIDAKETVIGHVSAPVAWDAEKNAVATRWVLDGPAPTLRVDHVGKDLAYPVAVDPVVNDNRYGADLATRHWDWAPGPGFTEFYGDAGWGQGMYQRMQTPVFYAHGAESFWYLNMAGRTASIRQVHAENMNHDTGQNAAGSPETCTYVAINSGATRTDLSDVWCDTYRGRTTNAGNWLVPHAAGNWAQVSVFANGGGTRGYFQQFVGVLVAALQDDDVPNGVSVTPSSTAWRTSASVSASASDPGLGIKKFNFTSPDASAWTGTPQLQGCDVICNTWASTAAVSVNGLPDGQSRVQASVSDPTGNHTEATTSVKLDRVAPTIGAFTGTLYDLRSTSFADTRAIRITIAGEGSVASPTSRRSGVRQIRLIVDGTIIADQRDFDQQDSYVPSTTGPESILRINGSSLPAGTHSVNVDVGDWSGNTRLATSFTITTAPDTAAPDVDPGGTLLDAADDFLVNGTSYTTSVKASDDQTGVKTVQVAVDGIITNTVNVSCANPPAGDGPCPLDDEEDIPVATAALAQGTHTARAYATDSAGNRGQSESWTFYVDKTAPTAATSASADNDGSTVSVTWTGDADPVLSATQDGSDLAKWTYRQRRNGGAWSSVATVTSPAFIAAGAVAGDTINIEVTSFDYAGNASPTATLTATVPDAPAGLQALGFNNTVICDGDSPADTAYRKVQRLNLWQGYADIAIQARGSVTCRPNPQDPRAPAAFAAHRQALQICVALKTGNSGNESEDYKDLKCSRRRYFRATTANHAEQLCRAGSQTYAVHFIIWLPESVLPGGPSPAHRWLAPGQLGCNATNAWKRVATRDGRPNAKLAQNLPLGLTPPLGDATGGTSSLDVDLLPPRGTTAAQRGWEAHHIIPSGDRFSAAAQAAGYACDIHPNGAVNGVWLRGRNLKSNQTAYSNLNRAERTRAAHSATFSPAYRTWIAGILAPFVNPDGSCKATGHAGMVNALRGLQDAMIAGKVDGS
jgi:hypothetical protein